MKKRLVKKPWGGEEWFAVNDKVTVKILGVNPNKKLSLQKHKNRSEFWKFLNGEGKVTIGKKTMKVKAGDEIFIKKGQLHRIESFSKGVKFLEVAFGKYDSKDIVRIEDDYGRA